MHGLKTGTWYQNLNKVHEGTLIGDLLRYLSIQHMYISLAWHHPQWANSNIN